MPQTIRTYDPITHLSDLNLDAAWVDSLPGNARCAVHDGVILVRRGPSTAQLVDGVAHALVAHEVGKGRAVDGYTVARLTSERLISLDALALGMAVHDGGVTAIAADLGVSPVTVRERLNTLNDSERTRLHDYVQKIQADGTGVPCTCLRTQLRTRRIA